MDNHDDHDNQARLLAEPTRQRIFGIVSSAGRPVSVDDVAAAVDGLHPQSVRRHLSTLVDARLLTRSAEAPVGRGRPRLLYTLHPAAESRWGSTSPYERLGLLLSEIIRTGDDAAVVGRRAGRRTRFAHSPSHHPADRFVEQMARHGFEPSVTVQDGNVDVVLAACPYESIALADPDTVCQLHLGLAYGIADAVGGLEVDELLPRDPRHAQCHLKGRLVDR